MRGRLGHPVPAGPPGDHRRLKSNPASLLVVFILIAASGLTTLHFVVTTITWKWGMVSYVLATAVAVAMIGALVMMDTPFRIPAKFAGWLSAALLLVLALLYFGATTSSQRGTVATRWQLASVSQ